MKAALVVVGVALIAGGAIGTSLGYRNYGNLESHFGPFRAETPISVGKIREILEERSEAGVPKAEVVGGNSFDFGVMRRNAKATHVFEIKNVGDGPLKLEVTGSTCKCTVGTLDASELAPGETTEVELEWTAKTSGKMFGQSANLKTNDPTQSELSLEVRGQVIDLIAAEPSAWNVGDVAATEPIEVRTTLYNHADVPIVITKIQWLDQAFAESSEVDVQRREVSAEEAGIHKSATEAYDVLVKVEPQAVQGRLNKRLRVEYRNRGEDDIHPPIEIVLTGRVVGELSLLGGANLVGVESGDVRLKLGQASVGEVLEEKIYLVFRGAKRKTAELKIGAIDPAEGLEAEIGKGSERGEMTVFPLTVRTKLSAPEMVRGGQVDAEPGRITIESEDPEVAPLVVNVLFRIGKPFGG